MSEPKDYDTLSRERNREQELKDAEIPTLLPAGRAEFEEWAKDIIRLANSPDNDSVRFALATMIMQFPASTAKVPKRTVVDMLHKGMANQVASAIVYELKTKQQEEAKKAAAELAATSGT